MTTPSKLDEARLRELAEAATPGPWTAVRCLRGGSSIDADEREVVESDEFGRFGAIEVEADASFIAAANPATILALLDALSAERERGDRAVEYIAQEIHAGRDFIGKKAWGKGTNRKYYRRQAEQILATQKAEGA